MPKIYRLNKTDRIFLWRKYLKGGLSEIQAEKRLESINNHLSKFIKKLKTQKKSKEEIEKRFKEEFEKICQKVDGEF